eukprot:SAG31_NODE_1528_length_8003_cov_1.749620_3_plen_78_part_00
MYSVGEFKIFHRTDCCMDRLVAARVVISDTDDYSSGRPCYEMGHVISIAEDTDGRIHVQGESGSCDGLIGASIPKQH